MGVSYLEVLSAASNIYIIFTSYLHHIEKRVPFFMLEHFNIFFFECFRLVIVSELVLNDLCL